ncbi:hypothetical protein [Anabaena sp. AL93]|nr:hypothetical protein [Anabaena sp. AL93]OBQ22280.1 MAG: hypothetical protein AN486_02555 [Anabaena sp. AL93]
MIEFIVIVESGADSRTATKLAERVLQEKFDWLDDDILQHCFQWSGLVCLSENYYRPESDRFARRRHRTASFTMAEKMARI